jgi:predicted amidohydrolase YtcJ
VLFAIFAFSWPLYNQKSIRLPDVHVICASKVYTANSNFETAECFAYSTSSGIFSAVGKKEHILKEYGNAPIRQLQENMTILPGLYDSHGHIMHVQSVFKEWH